ncbi:hypothetical protein AB0J52_17015 [Spirillospora sp. NPDC049652]
MTTGRISPRRPYDWLQDLAAALEELGVVGTLHNTSAGPTLAVVSDLDRTLDRDITCETVPGARPKFWEHLTSSSQHAPGRRLLPCGDPAKVASHLARAVARTPRPIARPDDPEDTPGGSA